MFYFRKHSWLNITNGGKDLQQKRQSHDDPAFAFVGYYPILDTCFLGVGWISFKQRKVIKA
jgi:hypothetical protein